MYTVNKIEDADLKSKLVRDILQDLPEWFGIDEATQWYIDDAKTSECLAVCDGITYVGFITISNSSSDCAEIVCMGVKKQYQGRGIGSLLVKEAEQLAAERYSYFQVKTVDEGHYKEYDQTNHFYQQCGFKKLEVFPNLWDEHNPCLVWIKYIGA